jgi:thiol:disulfide interchange protein DsbA
MRITKLFNSLCIALLTLFALGCDAQQTTLREGVDYTLLQAQSSTPKIEIIEFFSYACPHCNELDPYLRDWEKRLPKDVVFYRVPAPGNPAWASLAYTFYALEALGLIDRLHNSIFDAIHKDKTRLI